MAVDWGDYVVCDTGVSVPAPRSAARVACGSSVTDIPGRIALLVSLAGRNGVSLDGVDGLDHWFRCEVREDPAQAGQLAPEWVSVVGDIALYLGDLAIAGSPQLRRELGTDGSVHFSDDLDVDLDLVLDVTAYGLLILAGADAEHGHFTRILQGLGDRAARRT